MTRHLNGPALNKNTAEASRKWFNELPIQFDPDYVHMMDDFDRVALDSNTAHRWTVVEDAGASAAIQADTVGGRLILSSAATTDNDGSSIQGNEIWAVASGRTLWAEAYVQLSDADQMDFFFGLTENFATNPEAVLSAANRIGFQVDDGNASILSKTESGGTETSNDTEVDAADATFVQLGIKCIGTGVVEFYVNRILRQTHETNIPTANLALAGFHLSGDATGTKTSIWDYITCTMTR